MRLDGTWELRNDDTPIYVLVIAPNDFGKDIDEGVGFRAALAEEIGLSRLHIKLKGPDAGAVLTAIVLFLH